MNNYFTKKTLTLYFFSFFIAFSFSQTPKQTKEITKDYNLEKLNELETSFEKSFLDEQVIIERLAIQNNWPINYTDDEGTIHQLLKILNDKPIYIQTDNVDAAISSRANYLQNGGGLGLNLEGQGMTVYIWEVGGVGRVTHQEYDGIGGTDRLSIADGSNTLSFHAGHVTGTIIASGAVADAKGMAPQTKAIGYDQVNDLAEATAAAANGMLLSNHSYGVNPNNLTGANSWVIGAYIQDSKDWDDLMYNAPYYLQVSSAGNSGNDNVSNSNPIGGNSAYDKLTFNATSKNTLLVGASNDAIINGDGSLSSVTRAGFSSEGPTDDLRIKPDLMGNGVDLTSSFVVSDSAYGVISGTSMSSPNVCGSLLLLQQHYNNTNGVFMKAATLKGLALHTADDTNVLGPDANTGWGLMNTKVAAETITNNGFQSWVSEEVLTNGNTFTMDVIADGTSPLIASISWTDQGGPANTTGIFNDSNPVLINDLDIRVTQTANTFMPWKLTGVDTNAQDDNIVDPYERVDVSGASGTYTITVTHKGALVSGLQNFSLIVTGVTSNFNLSTLTSEQVACSNTDTVFSFNYSQIIGGATTNFSTTDVPVGASASISPTSLNADGTFDVTFSNLSNVLAGTYNINVIGDDGNETGSRLIKLRVLHPDFTAYPQSLTAPANGTVGTSSAVSLSWAENLNAESYFVEVSTNPSFSTIAYSSTQTNLDFDLSGLLGETVYYWRVRADNNCSNGNFSEVSSFQVSSVVCESTFTATDFSDGNIPFFPANQTASAPITVNGGFFIDSIEASFVINHSNVNDLRISLEGPAAIGSPVVNLFNNSCVSGGDGDGFDVTYSDLGTVLVCDNGSTPSISGVVLPNESLSAFNSLAADGIWTLRIIDGPTGGSGNLTAFSLDICTFTNIASIPSFSNNGFTTTLNSIYTFLASDIEVTTTAETSTQQIYTVIELPTVGILEISGSAMNVGDTFTQNDVNTGNVTFSNAENSTFTDQFKVDIQNEANGWLANQIVLLNSTLSSNEFELGSLSVWPNPASELINIKMNTISSFEDIFVNLYDIQGRTIKNVVYKVDSNTLVKTMDLNNVQNGIYLLEIKQGNKKSTKKIVINH